MAFPGGRIVQTDANAHAAGIRETSEEVGLDLTNYQYLGALPPIQITHRGKSRLGWLQPFVHLCSPHLPSLHLQRSEVAAGLWIPVTHLTDPANRTSVTLAENTRQLVFPGISYCGEVIWGLTYKVLKSILDLTDLETVQPDR